MTASWTYFAIECLGLLTTALAAAALAKPAPQPVAVAAKRTSRGPSRR